MSNKIVYTSNGQSVGDGMRITRVSEDGQKFEVMVDEKTERFSEVTVKVVVDTPVEEPTETPDVPTTDTGVVEGGEVVLSNQVFSPPKVFSGERLTRVSLNNVVGVYFEDCEFVHESSSGEVAWHSPFMFTASDDIRMLRCSVEQTGSPYPSGRGLVINGCSGVSVLDCIISGWRRAVYAYKSSTVIVDNCDISGFSGDGFGFSEISGLRVSNCYVHDIIANPDSGIHRDMLQFWSTGARVTSSDVTISDNLFEIGGGDWSQTIFMRNEIVDQGQAGTEMYYRDFTITNNTIRNCHLHGITIGEVDGITISGNTLETDLGDQSRPLNSGRTGEVTVPTINVSNKATRVVVEGNVLPTS